MSKNRKTVVNNPHNKIGVPVFFVKKELQDLYKNEHFQSLMNWVEGTLRVSKMIISDQFFHPSFTKQQRDLIVSIIFSCYDVVEDIEPLGKNGLVIRSKGVLTQTTF
jgi:hypothetical protein